MPKQLTIIQTHWPDFLFDCHGCPHADDCMKEGVCIQSMPTDGDHEVDDKINPGVVKAVQPSADLDANRFFHNEICGSLNTNFQYQYND